MAPKTLHQKIGTWLIDYGYMLRGGISMVVHRNPPKHYLGHIVPGKIPVVLIPGILGKWGIMKHLGDRISFEGHPVYIIPKLGYNVYSIPSSAQKLKAVVRYVFSRISHTIPNLSGRAEHIQKFITERNLKNVAFVTHSKGGLIGKYYLIHHNKDRAVIGMVAIAAPFSGSAMAKLIPHDSFRELRLDSKIIRDLEKHKEANGHIISIIPEYDNHVWAERGSYLDGAKNVEVPVSGHHKVLFSRHVESAVLAALKEISKNRYTNAK